LQPILRGSPTADHATSAATGDEGIRRLATAEDVAPSSADQDVIAARLQMKSLPSMTS